MYQAEKVKIDVAIAEKLMAAHNLTFGEFSQKMGFARSWWNGCKKNGGYMPINRAKLMCHLLGMDYSKLVIPEPCFSANPSGEQKPLYADDASIQGLVNSITNIELTVKRIEIQMRTVLKELGVK